ncbi:hypothetical protein HK100_009257 [Physocladia obscura]|uniref:Nudix hydrolase domain-containing protein n=1 Tax=Physocladia obscura TaxID=109957 RepID=A0AAD5SM27_9FUNG|nr:hypothetical protein HK100_009257 [Physocladia obscura]
MIPKKSNVFLFQASPDPGSARSSSFEQAIAPGNSTLHVCATLETLNVLIKRANENSGLLIVVVGYERATEGKDDHMWELATSAVAQIRNSNLHDAFVVLWSASESADAVKRSFWQRNGANMITESLDSVRSVLTTIETQLSGTGPLSTCPYCQIELPFYSLRIHMPLFHIQQGNKPGLCALCKFTHPKLAVHMSEAHDPSQSHKSKRQPVFSLVVARRPLDGKFLMVDEVCSWGWWLPGGGVDIGESLANAALRETLEEAGVDVELKGILRVEYTPSPHSSQSRLRVIYYAEPKDLTPPKCIPNYESAGACWVSLEQLKLLHLRGDEPIKWFQYVADGGAIWPLSILATERENCVFVANPF